MITYTHDMAYNILTPSKAVAKWMQVLRKKPKPLNNLWN